MTLVFDPIAEEYDRWFESPEGKPIYETELACLQSIKKNYPGRWLEVGVGTGRFASRMGIGEGIDPSPRMLKLATERRIKTYEGQAEKLPFQDNSFDGVLIALALCFIPNPEKALKECNRILRREGELLVGDITADSPWGQLYKKTGADGDPVWSQSSFLSGTELVQFTEKAGFHLRNSASTLFWKPTDSSEIDPRMEKGIISGAGFVGLLFTRAG